MHHAPNSTLGPCSFDPRTWRGCNLAYPLSDNPLARTFLDCSGVWRASSGLPTVNFAIPLARLLGASQQYPEASAHCQRTSTVLSDHFRPDPSPPCLDYPLPLLRRALDPRGLPSPPRHRSPVYHQSRLFAAAPCKCSSRAGNRTSADITLDYRSIHSLEPLTSAIILSALFALLHWIRTSALELHITSPKIRPPRFFPMVATPP